MQTTYSSSGSFVKVTRKAISTASERRLMVMYRKGRFEKARMEVARTGPVAIPTNLAELRIPIVLPFTRDVNMDRVRGTMAAMRPVCTIRMAVKPTIPEGRARSRGF